MGRFCSAPPPPRKMRIRLHPRVTATAIFLAVILAGCAPADDKLDSQPLPATNATHAPVPAVTAKATAQAPTGPVIMVASNPLRIQIESIGVDSDLMELGLTDEGALEVPTTAFPAGWFTGGPTPGELGPAVIAGHIDWVTGPGVFLKLGQVEAGDEVRITRTDGTVAVFRTVEVSQYPKDAFPAALVYGNIDHAGLRLISCGGAFNRSTGHYEDNIVVFAELVA